MFSKSPTLKFSRFKNIEIAGQWNFLFSVVFGILIGTIAGTSRGLLEIFIKPWTILLSYFVLFYLGTSIFESLRSAQAQEHLPQRFKDWISFTALLEMLGVLGVLCAIIGLACSTTTLPVIELLRLSDPTQLDETAQLPLASLTEFFKFLFPSEILSVFKGEHFFSITLFAALLGIVFTRSTNTARAFDRSQVQSLVHPSLAHQRLVQWIGGGLPWLCALYIGTQWPTQGVRWSFLLSPDTFKAIFQWIQPYFICFGLLLGSAWVLLWQFKKKLGFEAGSLVSLILTGFIIRPIYLLLPFHMAHAKKMGLDRSRSTWKLPFAAGWMNVGTFAHLVLTCLLADQLRTHTSGFSTPWTQKALIIGFAWLASKYQIYITGLSTVVYSLIQNLFGAPFEPGWFSYLLIFDLLFDGIRTVTDLSWQWVVTLFSHLISQNSELSKTMRDL